MTPTSPPFLISAYAASPAHGVWDPILEGRLLPALCSLPGVVGLEVPWVGALHPHDESWFLAHVPAGTQLSITALPWVMSSCARDARYGIASGDAAGRAAALADLRAVAADVGRLHRDTDARVAYVSLHTAPRGGGDMAELTASLREIAQWEWEGARLVIEHCDTAVPGQPYEKGFLSVADEIEAIHAAPGADIRMWLNWGRTAIETRDPDRVTAQIASVAATGLLAGLTFSGSSATDTGYGAAWEDRHLPIAETDPAASSLLTASRVAEAIRAAAPVEAWGLKTSRRPSDHTVDQVVSTVSANLTVVRDAVSRSARAGSARA